MSDDSVAVALVGYLITELRTIHRPTELRGDHQWCVRDEETWPCESALLADRAETTYAGGDRR